MVLLPASTPAFAQDALTITEDLVEPRAVQLDIEDVDRAIGERLRAARAKQAHEPEAVRRPRRAQ